MKTISKPESMRLSAKSRNGIKKEFSIDAIEDYCAIFSEDSSMGNLYLRFFWQFVKKYTNLTKCPLKVRKNRFKIYTFIEIL